MSASTLPRTHLPSPILRPIPEGYFNMGCAEGRDDERPVHRVWVDGFELAAHQTTNADYALFVAATNHPRPPNLDDPNFSSPLQPVTLVSWHDAIAYCEWLTAATGQCYRLPTEAEWERAARGTLPDEAAYPWGDTPPDQLPNYAVRWKTGPEEVGRYVPNAYGLYNLGDNVHEWCSDWYDAAYYATSPERNPQGLPVSARKASRGGSWRHHIKVTRTAARSSIPPEFKYADYGFRIARTSR